MSNQQRFQVGDLCVIVKRYENQLLVGEDCEIVSTDSGRVFPGTDCVIHVPSMPSPHDSGNWSAKFSQLRKKPPPTDYDGNQAGSWDLIPWQPSKVRERV